MVAKKKVAKKGSSKARLKNKAPRDLDLKGRGGSVKGGSTAAAGGSTAAKGGSSYVVYSEYDSFSGLGTGGQGSGKRGGGPPGPGGTGG